ncbi:hypothetical protein DNTS_008624 [Danionella cerebrum]|uniref:Uncharacterized protein n=1 Tax=Danionella cerebrum TaxID=2873325 RepID=A0A553QSZ4_9TELE|nr:hypothetical protein DNTS_008624 [Danionella translucida]
MRIMCGTQYSTNFWIPVLQTASMKYLMIWNQDNTVSRFSTCFTTNHMEGLVSYDAQ